MPAKQIYIRSRDEIGAKLQDAFADKSVQKVLLLFEGSTDITTGDSWDEACRKGTSTPFFRSNCIDKNPLH